MLLGGFAIWKGIGRIEKINRWLMPILLGILLLALLKALSLKGSMHGITYLFSVDWVQFSDPSLWVAALTQNAWDTGAGWGLFITYGAYMQMKFGIVKNAVITAVGNNLISLVCAVMIFGTCFAIMESVHARMKNPGRDENPCVTSRARKLGWRQSDARKKHKNMLISVTVCMIFTVFLGSVLGGHLCKSKKNKSSRHPTKIVFFVFFSLFSTLGTFRVQSNIFMSAVGPPPSLPRLYHRGVP